MLTRIRKLNTEKLCVQLFLFFESPVVSSLLFVALLGVVILCSATFNGPRATHDPFKTLTTIFQPSPEPRP